MSGSGFGTAAADVGALHERISAATAVLTNFEFPGEGKVERAFGSVKASLTADAEAAGQYANAASLACSTQDSIDHGLELAPTRDDLNALLRSGDHAALDAAVEDHKQAVTAHENATLGNAFPTAPSDTRGVPTDSSVGEGEGEGTLAGEGGTDDATEGNEDEDTPVTMSEGGEGSAPVTMSEPGDSPRVQMSDGLPPPTPLNGNAVSTETSSDTMTPTSGAGTGSLSQPTQATPGGAPIQGTHGAPNPAFGATGGAPGQLSSATGSKPSTPKTSQRKDDDTASTSTPIVPVAGVTNAPTHTSPASTPPGTGAGAPPPTTPPTTNGAPTAPGQGGTGQVGGGGGLAGAGARPPGQTLGSGETVTGQSNKPILRYEEPIEPQPGDDNYDWFTHGETDPLLSDGDDIDKKGAA